MSNSTVKTMIEKVESVLTTTHSLVESMSVGDRIQMKELASKVATQVGSTPKDVLTFVDYFVHNTDLAYVARGKNGGVVRGVKAVAAVKEEPAPDVNE